MHKTVWLGVLMMVLGSGCHRERIKLETLKILDMAIADDTRNLDPALATDPDTTLVVGGLFESLYQIHYLSSPPRATPLLVSDKPKVSKNGRVWTFQIKSEVYFHPKEDAEEGTPLLNLTTKDVLASWKRLAHPQLHSSMAIRLGHIIKGYKKFYDKVQQLKEPIKEDKKQKEARLQKIALLLQEQVPGLKAVGPHTLQVELLAPYPNLPFLLSRCELAVMPEEQALAQPDELLPRGTGPFHIQERVRGHRITLGRFKKYHGGFYPTNGNMNFRTTGLLKPAGKPLPLLDGVRLHILPEEGKAWSQFSRGKLDVMGLPVHQYFDARNQEYKGVHVNASEMATDFFYLFFNHRDPLVGQNQSLRQLIGYALDRKEITQKLFHEMGEVAHHLLPQGFPGRPANALNQKLYQPKRAMELRKTLPKNLSLRVHMRGNKQNDRLLGKWLMESLKKVNIDLEVRYHEFHAFQELMRSGKFQMAMGGWRFDYPDPLNLFENLHSREIGGGTNLSKFSFKMYDGYLDRASKMEMGPARQPLISQLNLIIQEKAPWIPLFHVKSLTVAQPWVQPLRNLPYVFNSLKYIGLDLAKKVAFMDKEASKPKTKPGDPSIETH